MGVMMKFMVKQVFSIMLVLCAMGQTFADTVTLKDGRTFDGEIKSQDAEKVILEMNGIEMNLPIAQVSRIDLSDAVTERQASVSRTEKQSSEQGIATVPAGTAFMVKISEGFNSRQNKAGQRFTAKLESNLMVGNIIVAPKGSDVYGVLTDVKRAGRVAGTALLKFELNEITINDVMYPLKTQSIIGTGENEIKSTAGKTARSALVGGLINGSDGAKTGAKVGAGVSVLTRGHDIQVAEGMLQEFILAAPFTPQL